MTPEKARRLGDMMIQQSAEVAPFAVPVPNAGIRTPLPVEDGEEHAAKLNAALVDADGYASSISANLDGALNRSIASATATQASIANSLNLPVTLAVNDATHLFSAVSRNIANAIDTSIAEATEQAAVGMPGLLARSQPFALEAENEDKEAAAYKLSAEYGVTFPHASGIVAAWPSGLAAQYLYGPTTPTVITAVRDSVTGSSASTAGMQGSGMASATTPSSSPASVTSTAQSVIGGGSALPTLRQWLEANYGPGYAFWTSEDGATNDKVVGLRLTMAQQGKPHWWHEGKGPSGHTYIIALGIPAGGVMPPQLIPPYGSVAGTSLAFTVTPAGTGSGPPPSPGLPPPPPTPIPPAPPKPPVPAPVIPACIPICNPPSAPAPTCPEPEECEECPDCNASLWFNPDTCRFQVFVEGEGPPRTERQWIEVGTTADEAKLKALLDEHCPKEEPEPPTGPPRPPLPPIPGGGGVMTPVQLCNFLPPAASLTRFSTPALLTASLEILANAVSVIPGGGAIATVISGFASMIASFQGRLDEWLQGVINNVLQASGCGDGRAGGLYAVIALIGLLEKWVSTGLADLQLPYVQQARYACPTGVPSASEATAAHLANEMSYEEWKCLVRANNFDEAQYEKVALAMRRKLEPVQLIIARARNLITADQYNDKMRTLGFIKEDDRSITWDTSEWVPGPSDIVRFMVRDAADLGVVRQFGLDDEFAAKYTPELKQLAASQRVTDETMQLYWRSHWNIPSPTQLFQFYRRLRHQPQFWPSGNPEADVKAALIQQDILPKWINAFLEVTYQPLGRIDTKRLLEQDVINEQQAVEAWEQLGYSTENAKRLADLAEKGASKAAVKHPVTRRMASGELSEAEAEDILRSENVPQRFFRLIFNRAVIEANALKRKRCIAGVKRRYLTGDISTTELPAELMSAGVPLQAAQTLAASIACERQSRGKEVAAAQLQGWYIDGVISSAEFNMRLLRLGYTQDDATLLLRHANILFARKETARERAERARQLAEQRRQEADARRDEADREREIAKNERQQAKLRREQREAAAAIQRAERILATARKNEENIRDGLASLYADSSLRLAVPIDVAVAGTDSIFVRLLTVGLTTTNEALSAMAESLKLEQVTDFDSWEDAARDILSSNVVLSPFPQT